MPKTKQALGIKEHRHRAFGNNIRFPVSSLIPTVAKTSAIIT